jgi:hypothetical protein
MRWIVFTIYLGLLTICGVALAEIVRYGGLPRQSPVLSPNIEFLLLGLLFVFLLHGIVRLALEDPSDAPDAASSLAKDAEQALIESLRDWKPGGNGRSMPASPTNRRGQTLV